MVLFRPHREYLVDALKEAREISSLEEVRPTYAKKAKLTLEKGSFDKRCDWDTYYALADGQCFGMTNGPLKGTVID